MQPSTRIQHTPAAHPDARRDNELAQTALSLVSQGKGLLAADETPGTLTKRFDALHIASTATSRRDYRELLLTTPGVADFISGVILQDETIRQQSASGPLLVAVCRQRGIIPGIKVDFGAKPLAGTDGERVTEGLDGLRDRLTEYRGFGARFAKWRGVFSISDTLPSAACVMANADALARYAALCQEQGLVPIVEPEVLMNGTHTIERCEEVTDDVLHAVFDALFMQGVRLDGMLLKPSMVIAGDQCPQQADVDTVAAATLRVLRRHVPPAVPGVVFLSGGQSDVVATRHLDAMSRAGGATPWKLSFSYGRALQDAALAAWLGRQDNVEAAQAAFLHRARCNHLAATASYSESEEQED